MRLKIMNHEAWDKRRGRISAYGGWRQAEGKVLNHGHNMLEDLVGSKSWFDIYILNCTGRMPAKNLAEWFNAAFICISWPDSRIWCNTMGAFAGTARAHPVTGATCGILASDSLIYGVGPLTITAHFITELKNQIDAGKMVAVFFAEKCRKNGKLFLPGWARPLSRGDERIEPMQKISHKLGFGIGAHMRCAMLLDDYVYDNTEPKESINIGGYYAAFLLDQGYSPDEISRLMTILVNGGIHACHTEAADDIPHGYLPLKCIDIDYQGEALRVLKSNS